MCSLFGCETPASNAVCIALSQRSAIGSNFLHLWFECDGCNKRFCGECTRNLVVPSGKCPLCSLVFDQKISRKYEDKCRSTWRNGALRSQTRKPLPTALHLPNAFGGLKISESLREITFGEILHLNDHEIALALAVTKDDLVIARGFLSHHLTATLTRDISAWVDFESSFGELPTRFFVVNSHGHPVLAHHPRGISFTRRSFEKKFGSTRFTTQQGRSSASSENLHVLDIFLGARSQVSNRPRLQNTKPNIEILLGVHVETGELEETLVIPTHILFRVVEVHGVEVGEKLIPKLFFVTRK